MKTKTGFLSKIAVLCYLLTVICSCNLFTSPTVDLLKVIDDEVAWANAEKLNVTITFPQGFGTSNPPQGNISNPLLRDMPMDIRRGHPFTVEFSPTDNVVFMSWIARYSDLSKEKPGDTFWDGVIGAEIPQLVGGENLVRFVRQPSTAGRRTAQVTIFTSEPVTLVPMCDDTPSITSISSGPLPTDIYQKKIMEKDANDGKLKYARYDEQGEPEYTDAAPECVNDDIFMIYFNVNLDPITVVFSDGKTKDAITITMRDNESGVEEPDPYQYFKKPRWHSGYLCIIIEPEDKLPLDNNITLTIGTDVTSYLNLMPVKPPVSFSWITKEL